MKIIRKIFYAFVLGSCYSAQAIASEPYALLLPDSFGKVKWHPVVYLEGKHSFKAMLPGTLEEAIRKDHLYFFHSTYSGVHYGIYFNPSLPFHPPLTEEDFIDSFKHLENAQIIALKPKQPPLIYMLQIHIFNEVDRTLQAIFRVYATDNTLYFAMVEGGDFAFIDDFFQSIQIEK